MIILTILLTTATVIKVGTAIVTVTATTTVRVIGIIIIYGSSNDNNVDNGSDNSNGIYGNLKRMQMQ